MSRLFKLIRFALAIFAFSISIASVQSQIVIAPKPAKGDVAESLIEIIRASQKRYVRESWGERSSECFTSLDLDNFHDSNVVKRLVEEMRKNKKMIAVSESLKNLPIPLREDVLEKATSTYKPTWAQIGKIDRRGQTEAGQQAEKEIASAIVTLASDLAKGNK